MAQDQVITLDKIFTKGFVRDRGTNKVPAYFADTAINIRLVNGGITSRDGFREVYNSTGDAPQGITANESNNKLLIVHNGTLYSVDPDAGTAHSKGSITSTARARFINYGAYTIILTGDQRPYYYNGTAYIDFSASLVVGNTINLKVNTVSMTAENFDTTNNQTLDNIAAQLVTDFPTLIASATRNSTNNGIDITPVNGVDITISDIAVTGGASQATGTTTHVRQVAVGELANNINPSFGGTFAKFTIINRNDTKNVCMVSRPIALNTQGYCKDWTGTDAYTISLKGDLEGCCATLSRFWLFTDKSIEYITPSFLDDTGAYVPTTFGDGEPLASEDCVVAAGDLVFYMTKSKKIKSIGYQGNITEPQISTLTDLENAGIQDFMENELAEDQSLAKMHYDRKNELIKIWCVGVESTVANVCLCRDIVNNTWIQDMDKFYKDITTFGTKQYAISAFDRTVYEDEDGNDDDGQPIEWEFVTQNYTQADPSIVAMRRGATIGGQIGTNTLIGVQAYIDEVKRFDKYIDSEIENPAGVGGVGEGAIGEYGVGDSPTSAQLEDFTKVISLGRLRSTGKALRHRFYGGNIGQNFILDYLSITSRIRNRRRVKDKRFTSTI